MTTQEEILKIEDLSDDYEVPQTASKEETLKTEDLSEDFDEVAESNPPESPVKVKEEVDDQVEFSEKAAAQPPKYSLRARKRKVYSEAGPDPDLGENKSQTRKKPKDLKHSKKLSRSTKPKSRQRNKDHSFTCDMCHQSFGDKGWYERHIAKFHDKQLKSSAPLHNKQQKSSVEDSYTLDMDSLNDADINIKIDMESIDLKPEITLLESIKKSDRVAGNDKTSKILVREPFKIHLHPHKNKDYGTMKESNTDSPPSLIHDEEKKLPPKNPSNFCSICSQHFSSENELDEHDCNVFSCDQCVRIFRTQDSLDRHFELHASDPSKILYDCEHCHRVFKRKSDLINHSRLLHKIEVLFF